MRQYFRGVLRKRLCGQCLFTTIHIKMATARDRKAWTQILQLYHKEYPHLWDKTHSMYSNKKMRNDSFKVLTQLYRENFDMDASIGKVKKKLENMRTTYLRELKKVKQSLSSGADVYEPTLWYFDQFKFLGNTYEPCGSFSDDNSHADTTDPLKTEDTTMDSSDSEPSTSREIKTKNIDFKKKQKITVFKNHEHLSAPKPATMNNEDWEVMGRSIGLQLRDINKKQLTIATKLISDTIYFAKLNRLSEESHVEVGSGSLIAPVCSICAAQVDD